MSETISSVRGFKDILPGEVEKWQFVEETARDIFSTFGVMEIKIPILEKTTLFQRGIGETTDIVEKEMYTFVDKGEESLTLRPEATASVIRAYLQHSLHAQNPLTKFFTIGPMFRRERPQKGRLRQFHQINVEFLGIGDAIIDAEIILMLMYLLKRLNINDLRLELNSLGCGKCRPAFRSAVTDFLNHRKSEICDDCRRRMDSNPLRVFDCKIEGCRSVVTGAPIILDFLCDECAAHFESVRDHLNIFDIPFDINPRMVRGLDYYTRTAFEVTAGALGAQNAVAGGGRYDRLVSELGGPDLPGIGFAVGMERLIVLLSEQGDGDESLFCYPDIFIAAIGRVARTWAFALCNYLRMSGIHAEMGYEEKSLKSQMKRSDKLKSAMTLILGDQEIENNEAQLRDMKNSTQETISLDHFDRIAETILNKISGRTEKID
jgi:histidyl-tRNA synthetase